MNEQAQNGCFVRSFLLTSGNFLFKFRNALFPAIFVCMFLFTRPALFLGNETLDYFIVTLGILAALAGQCFRLAVIGYAYIKRGGKDGKVYADDLVIQGFYAHTRNPMYVGNFLIAVGLGLIYGSPWVYFFVIPFFTLAYLSIVMAEETYLRQKFGKQYEDYEKQVNRFIPDFRGIKESLGGFRYDWRKAIRKDYGTLFATLFGIVFINIWKQFYLYGFASRKETIILLAALIIPIALGYAFVRFLKLTGRLASLDQA